MSVMDQLNYRRELAQRLTEAEKSGRRNILEQSKATTEYEKAKETKISISKAYFELKKQGFIIESENLKTLVIICKEIELAGGRGYLVGGSVRDMILHIPPKDFDVEVYGITYEKLTNLLQKFGEVNTVGASFAVIKLKIEELDLDLDFSLPREDSKTGVKSTDFAITSKPFMSKEDACKRRDFTINALLVDVLTGELYDYFGGVEDLKNKILKVTDEVKFKDDASRVLRALQFIARFGLTVERDSEELMKGIIGDLKHLSKDKLIKEWKKLLLKSIKPSIGLNIALQWGIFLELHPEIANIQNVEQDAKWHPEGNVWIHTLMVVDEARKIITSEKLSDEDKVVIMFGALLHDLGKALTTKNDEGKISSIGHEKAGVAPAKNFMNQIGLEKKVQEKILKLVEHHIRPSLLFKEAKRLKDLGQKLSVGSIKKLATDIYPLSIRLLVLLAKADYLGRGPFIENGEEITREEYEAGEWLLKISESLNLSAVVEKPKKYITGIFLKSLGVQEGPNMGKIIDFAETVVEKGLEAPEKIQEYIRKRIEKYPNIEEDFFKLD